MTRQLSQLFAGMPPFDRWLVMFALAVSSAALLNALVSALEDRRAPIFVTGMEALNSPIPPGGDLLIRIYRDKVRDCPLTSFRYATNADGLRYPFINEAKPGGGPVDSAFVDIVFPTPQLPPGAYTFHNTVVYHCPDSDHVIAHPTVNFTVRD